MTDWRLPLASLMTVMLVSMSAASVDELQPETAPEAQPAPKPEIESRPRSPEEETAQSEVKLDTLFEQLAMVGNPNWERVQSEIWAQWAHSGSPAMDLLLARAEGAMQAGEQELALRFLNDLVRLAPDFAEGWNKRATLYFLLEEYGRSVADIQRTLALEERHFGALSGLGIILDRLGDKKGAMRAFRRVLEINPNLPGAIQAVERLAPEVDGRDL
jgi:tetratricopeptide (TPR) repeat protein